MVKVKSKRGRRVLALALCAAAAAFLYADNMGSDTVHSVRMPRSHIPHFGIAFEIPGTEEEVLKLLNSKHVQGEALRSCLEAGLWTSFRLMMFLMSSTLVMHRLLVKEFPHGRPGVKWGLMLSLSFWVLDWQRHALWLSLRRAHFLSGGGTEDEEKKQEMLMVLILVVSRFRWVAFHMVVALLARAYQLHFAKELPETIWHIPAYLGSTDLVIPTVFGASAALGMLGSVVPSMYYFIGVSMDSLR